MNTDNNYDQNEHERNQKAQEGVKDFLRQAHKDISLSDTFSFVNNS